MENSVISEAARGNMKAFKSIFDFYLPRMRPVCLRYAHTDFEAEDILQEAFIKIFHNLNEFRFQGSFEGWVRRIVVNTALNHHKKNRQYYAFEQIDEEIDNEDDGYVEDIEESASEALMKLIEELPRGYKLVFNLYVFEDFSHKEIGEMLGITEGTSRSQYAKAKKMIKRLISRQRNDQKSSLIGKK